MRSFISGAIIMSLIGTAAQLTGHAYSQEAASSPIHRAAADKLVIDQVIAALNKAHDAAPAMEVPIRLAFSPPPGLAETEWPKEEARVLRRDGLPTPLIVDAAGSVATDGDRAALWWNYLVRTGYEPWPSFVQIQSNVEIIEFPEIPLAIHSLKTGSAYSSIYPHMTATERAVAYWADAPHVDLFRALSTYLSLARFAQRVLWEEQDLRVISTEDQIATVLAPACGVQVAVDLRTGTVRSVRFSRPLGGSTTATVRGDFSVEPLCHPEEMLIEVEDRAGAKQSTRAVLYGAAIPLPPSERDRFNSARYSAFIARDGKQPKIGWDGLIIQDAHQHRPRLVMPPLPRGTR